MKKQFENIGAFAIGHRFGLDPYGTIDSMIKANMKQNLSAMIDGFDNGRREYVEYNGPLENGIPKHILCMQKASEFSIDGMLNIKIDENEYNETQWKHIRVFYEAGKRQHNVNWEINLGAVLARAGITYV